MYALLLFGALASYMLATIHLGFLALARPGGRASALSLAPVGTAVHTAALVLRAMEVGRAPLVGYHEALSFVSWGITLVLLAIAARRDIGSTGAVVMPAAALALAAGIMAGAREPSDELLRSPWLGLHASTSILGDAAFLVTFVLSLLYLVKEAALRRKVHGHGPGSPSRLAAVRAVERLPALEALDGMQLSVARAGFSLLTLGMVSGAVWAHGHETAALGLLDPKVLGTAVTWGIYGALLLMRLRQGWGGHRQAVTSIAGFLTALATFLGASAVSEHRFL